MARCGRLLGAGICAGVLLTSASSARAASDIYGVLSTSGGYSDNAFLASEPQPGPDAGPGPEADTFAEVRPTLFMLFEQPRSRTELSYTFATQVYLNNEEANSYTNEARLSWLDLVSAQTDLLLALEVSQGERTAFQAGGMITGPAPPGRLRTVEARASESLVHNLSSPGSITQGLSVRRLVPFGEGSSLQAVNTGAEVSAGYFREWPNTRWGMNLSSGYSISEATFNESDVEISPEQHILVSILLGSHQRQLTSAWDLTLSAGVVQVANGKKPDIAIYEPAGGFGIGYHTPSQLTEMSAGYNHEAAPSTFTGGASLIDTARLVLSHDFLGEELLVGSLQASYTFSRQFNFRNATISNRTDLYQGLARMTWRVEPDMLLGASYTYQRQVPRELEGMATFISEVQQSVVMVTLTARIGSPPRRRYVPSGSRVGESRRDGIEEPQGSGSDGRTR